LTKIQNWLKFPYKITALYNLLARTIFKYLYRGDNIYCPLCGWKGIRFFGERCPNCISLPRHRLIPFSIIYFDLGHQYKALLHIGPNKSESNYIKKSLHPKLYLRLNLYCSPNTNFVGDLTKLPFLTESIDFIILWHVLEHIKDDHAAIAEIYRVLRRGGNALISVPIYPPGREATFEEPGESLSHRYLELYGHHDHVRACGLDYCKRFIKQGFIVKELRTQDTLTPEFYRFGLSAKHVVWCCHKG
jgi:SAM-dependent methyltransferase